MHARQRRFTVSDIAEAAGVSEAKVRRDIRGGTLSMESLKSISVYVIRLALVDGMEGRTDESDKTA